MEFIPKKNEKRDVKTFLFFVRMTNRTQKCLFLHFSGQKGCQNLRSSCEKKIILSLKSIKTQD